MNSTETQQRQALHYEPAGADDPADRPQVADLLVRRAAIAFEELNTQWTTKVGLGTHERMALSVLWIHGPMQMSELASRIGLSRAAVTTLVDRLEADGWMKRTDDPHDRRRTILVLEREFSERCRGAESRYQVDMRDLASAFDDDEWKAIAAFVEGWHDIAERQAAEMRERVG